MQTTPRMLGRSAPSIGRRQGGAAFRDSGRARVEVSQKFTLFFNKVVSETTPVHPVCQSPINPPIFCRASKNEQSSVDPWFRFGSVCSGIGGAELAFAGLGGRSSFMSEIEPFPRAVLEHHFPETPLHGDFTTIQKCQYDNIDILVGGTPCQSFSIAGLRRGLADARGNLAVEFIRLADRLKPSWILWENVPGVLSSNGGRDFGSFLGALGHLGYGWCYRVLDAQYFRLAQRRKRVFVVGYLGDWRRAAAVLFEPACMRWDSAPSREAREGVAPTISARPTGGGLGTDFDCDGGLIAGAVCAHSFAGGMGGRPEGAAANHFIAYGGGRCSGPVDVATARTAKHSRHDFESETFITHALRADEFDASEDGTGRGTPIVPVAFSSKDYGCDAGELAPTLRAMGHASSHPNGGGQIAITVASRGREGGAIAEVGGATWQLHYVRAKGRG